MRMLYGVNQADQCRISRWGRTRAHRQRLREIDTRLIRLFLFDKGAPDPVTEWPVVRLLCAGRAQRRRHAHDHVRQAAPAARRPARRRWFANQCADVVWNCIEQWGGEDVRDWYWCVWNEPNNDWISGRSTSSSTATSMRRWPHGVLRWLAPHLGGRKPLIGGPAVEGFQPFWWTGSGGSSTRSTTA